jgi:nickel/cobalt transporter (NiCoT) family protein
VNSLALTTGHAVPKERAFQKRAIAVCVAVSAVNLGIWSWALAAFHERPALLGIGLAIYGLGLRHAVDADHIAAIDNVTRKLMRDNSRPVTVGLFFALGHSSIVVLVAASVGAAVTSLRLFQPLQDIGAIISSTVSVVFLLAIAIMNIAIFVSIYRAYQKINLEPSIAEAELDRLLDNRGYLGRMLRPLFALITRSWHMFPLGFLFGLGFDTATEVALFGISAAQTAKGTPFAIGFVLPILFAAGMSLVDTIDGALMLSIYDWAYVKPKRKVVFNMAITLVSIVVALIVCIFEAVRMIGTRFELARGMREFIDIVDKHFNVIGLAIIVIFLGLWASAYAVYRVAKYEACPIRTSGRGSINKGFGRGQSPPRK